METFNPLNHPICFQVPDRINVPSAWYEHIPFAFYLMDVLQPKCLVELGTHAGVSYAAFCQAIQNLTLNTKCFAIDTWEGDKMAGYYGQEVYEELRDYHDSHYSKFSSLLKMTFDEGVNYFSDNSIDLLHIDGLHTYEAIKHDFENWFRKLTPNAIVLFHDTNVHENDFGVWKYWEELKEKYTNFEFFHGHGLGVLTLADNFPQGLHIDDESSSINKFRTFFAVLGQKHLFENSIINTKQELENYRGQNEGLISTISRSNELLERVTQEKANAEQTVQKLEMELAAEKANAEQAVQKLEMELAAEKANAEQTVQKLEMELAAEKANAEQAVQKLEMELAAEKANAEQTVQKLEMELAAEKANLTCSTQNLEQKSEEFHHQMVEKDETHARELQKVQAEQSRLEQDFNAQVSQYAELEQSLNFANHEIIDYYNSTSWKITRPLRWISKKLRGSNV
jgi:hypothetical protein